MGRRLGLVESADVGLEVDGDEDERLRVPGVNALPQRAIDLMRDGDVGEGGAVVRAAARGRKGLELDVAELRDRGEARGDGAAVALDLALVNAVTAVGVRERGEHARDLEVGAA